MDKNAIKKFAVWARRELISRVSQKALQYGITEDSIVPATATSVNGVVLSNDEIKQRRALIEKISDKGYQHIMEEVAYTWFNRFIALRFMEVNSYLPSHVRVFTDDENNFKPQILTEAINLDFDGLNMDKVYELKDANDNEGLFKYLIIVQCNAFNPIMPRMFQKISDYTELLFPDNLLREGSVIQQMIELIPEEDWKDAIQIIGWLYQFYNIEPKAEVFAKKSGKISKEEIPAATQLFTPDWIVRYMVENSLGRLWIEGHPNEELKSEWKYYLDEAEQEAEVQLKLSNMRKEYASITPEQIRCIDPCSGSGHILAYMFDVFVQIYEAYGYTAREAVSSIIENNIYGLDIDERAAQLAYFSVIMKARQYDRRFFSRKDEDGNLYIPQPHVHVIIESNGIDKYAMDYFVNGNANLKNAINSIFREMRDAKEYGSILNITPVDFSALYARFKEVYDDINMNRDIVLNTILPLVKVAEIMATKYSIVVTNPPYMAVGAAGAKLSEFVKKNYVDSKTDLYAVFIEKCNRMCKENGFQGMITMHSWMFLSSFEKMRANFLKHDTINMAHLGPRAFDEIGGEVVQTTTFVVRKSYIKNYYSTYCRLIEPMSQQGKEKMYLGGNERYITKRDKFTVIPGSPIAYWINDNLSNAFSGDLLGNYAQTKQGFATGDNERFLRFWHEVSLQKTSIPSCENIEAKWIPCNKGGSFRKWYGNNIYLANWENDGLEMRNFKGSVIRNPQFYFREGITWSSLANQLSLRYSPKGFIFESKGSMCFVNDTRILQYILGVLNSVIAAQALSVLSPTLDFHEGPMLKVPVTMKENVEEVNKRVDTCIRLSRDDWDAFENSWDFKQHPLIKVISNGNMLFERGNIYLSECYQLWEDECAERFAQLKANEEELNRIFIDTYGLQDDLTAYVAEKDVSVRLADKKREIQSLISYAVGCMFGRYSLDAEGLAFAGGEWNSSRYVTFAADKDNIIPICDDEYFEDDIVNRFIRFIEVVYGKQSLENNLEFIAMALGGTGRPKEVLRKYFMNEFYADHLKNYQKRPIYWLFDSGKKNGFKALVYMHRYQPDIIARMRTDYVHEQQSRYRTAITDLEQRIASAITSERVKLNKKLKTLIDQSMEIQAYEEKIHHLADQYISIDLDDGVKKNYEIFKDVLAKIK